MSSVILMEINYGGLSEVSLETIKKTYSKAASAIVYKYNDLIETVAISSRDKITSSSMYWEICVNSFGKVNMVGCIPQEYRSIMEEVREMILEDNKSLKELKNV